MCLDCRIKMKVSSKLFFSEYCRIKTVPVLHRSRVVTALCSALIYIDAKLEVMYSQTPMVSEITAAGFSIKAFNMCESCCLYSMQQIRSI